MSDIDLASLAERPLWVAWRNESRGGKATKVPYGRTGKAKADDPSTWLTRGEAEALARKMVNGSGGGIGIEFAALDAEHRLGGIDLDTCRDPTSGTIEPWALEVIERIGSYAEVSPSGCGAKVYFRWCAADLDTLRQAMRTDHGKQWKRGSGAHPPAIELHLGNRYFAVTGLHLEGTPADIRPVALETLTWLIGDAGPKFAGGDKEKSERAGTDSSRSAAAFRKGAQMRRAGKTYEEMVEALRTDPGTAEWYRQKGEAAGGRELRRIWERAGTPNTNTVIPADLTEDAIARAFAEQHAEHLRFDHDAGAWFRWDGNIWRREETMLAFEWCREQCRAAAAGLDNAKLRAVLGRASTASAVERFARADRAFAVTAATWDRDPFLLGTPAGTVDLRTGRLRSPMQTDFVSKSTAVAPADRADCPRWRQFLEDATRGDAGFVGFLRQWCGYCLAGDIREHALLFIFGPGGNGKTVLLNTVSTILGDYAATAAMDTFTASQGDRHPTDLAMLRGARLVSVSETEEGRSWAETRIKALTGGDAISARFMRQDFFTFKPTFKITVIGNHKPILRNVDEAARRRFNLAPFVFKPTAPDKVLEEKLRAEHPAILRWCIDGCLDWQANGLVRPSIVASATAEYFAEQDTIRRWVEDCCEASDRPPHVADTSASLFASWRNYALTRSEEPGSARTFADRLRMLGFEAIKDTAGIRGRGFRGLKVLISQESYPDAAD